MVIPFRLGVKPHSLESHESPVKMSFGEEEGGMGAQEAVTVSVTGDLLVAFAEAFDLVLKEEEES